MLSWTCPRPALVGAGALLVLSTLAPAAPAAAAVGPVPGSHPRPVVEAVSVKPNGRTAGRMFGQPAVSDDGQRVAFLSTAGTLMPGVTGGCPQVYVRDRARGVTLLASSDEGGAPATGGCNTGTYPWTPMSGDGRLVAFVSDAPSLLRGPGRAAAHVFVKHLDTGRLERIAVPVESSRPGLSRSVGAVSMSADGRYLAVSVGLGLNEVTNHVGYWYDRATRTWQRICHAMVARCVVQAVSPDGRYVAYEFEPRVIAPGDRPRLYVFDRVTGRSRWVAGTPASQDHDPTLMKFSDDGATLVVSWLSFDTPVTTGAVTVHRVGDFAEQQLIRFPGLGEALDVDRTGRRLAISYSRSGRLGFDQVFDAAVYDRVSGRLRIASVAADGSPGNGTSIPGGITPDARTVVMSSSASNLAPGDRPGDEEWGRDCLVATFPPRT